MTPKGMTLFHLRNGICSSRTVPQEMTRLHTLLKMRIFKCHKCQILSLSTSLLRISTTLSTLLSSIFFRHTVADTGSATSDFRDAAPACDVLHCMKFGPECSEKEYYNHYWRSCQHQIFCDVNICVHY